MGLQEASLTVIAQSNTSGVGTTVWNADVTGVKTSSPTKLMQDNNIIHDKVVVCVPFTSAQVDNAFFIVQEGLWSVQAFSYLPRVAGSGGAATVDLKTCTGTQAPSSGTTQLSAALDLVGVADTLQNATIILAPTVVGPGGRFAFDVTGTLTSVVGLAQVALVRVG